MRFSYFLHPFSGATKKFIESSTKIFQYVTFLLVVETLSVIPVVQSPWTGTWQVLKCGHYQKVQLWVQQWVWKKRSQQCFASARNSKCTSSPSSLLEVLCLLEMLSSFEMLCFLEVLCLLEVPRLLEMLCFLRRFDYLRCIAYLVCFAYLSCFPHFRCFTYLRGNLFKTLKFSRLILGKSLWKSLLFNK